MGEVAGAEVVQVYLALPETDGVSAPKKLVAFQKVRVEPGAYETVELTIAPESRMRFDEERGSWDPVEGRIDLSVGTSSQQIVLSQSVDTKKARAT